MDTGLPKSLFLVILMMTSLFPLSPFDILHNANEAASEDFVSLSEDALLRAFNKAKQEIPDYDPVFLQFSDLRALEPAVQVLEGMGIPILHRYSLLPLLLVGELTHENLVAIAKQCSITNVHPNKVRTLVEPPEQLVAQSLDDTLNSSRLQEIIKAKELREAGYDGSGIIIAILDTGVDGTHPDLVDKIIQEESFVKTHLGYSEDEDASDDLGHGTGVAGTAVGTGEASNGLYTGVAPGARLWNVKVLNSFGSGREAGIVAGIEYATFGPDNQRDPSDPDIINLSLGGFGGPDDLSSLAVDAAVAQGVVVTASAGNEGPFFSSVGSPGAALHAITVGATKLDNELTTFSSRGFNLGKYPDPDIVAPGQNIISPLSANSFLGEAHRIRSPPKYIQGRNGNYIALSGTSLSSPVVAGACALLLDAFPAIKDLGPIALRVALMRTANRTHPSFQKNPNLGGAGALDVANAVKFLENLNNSLERDLVLVFPHLLLSDPAFVAFPGNQFNQKILLLSAFPGTYTFELEGSIKSFVQLEETSIHLEQADVVPVDFTVSLPLDINPMVYEHIDGLLNVQMDGELVMRLPFHPIDVRYPKLRVYFDNFHNRGPTDTPFSNFFEFTGLLRNNSIDVVVHDSFISSEALAPFDILLLPDVELTFSEEEIQAIQQFLENGGNLVVLGAEKESTAAEALNELLDPFGITLTSTIEFATDQGVRWHHEENLNVTSFTPHPLLQNVTALTWKTGVGLAVDEGVSNTQTLATLTLDEVEHTVLALHGGISSHQGNVVVLGTDYLFYDDLLNETDSSNRLLAENLFEWLTPDYELLPMLLANQTRAAPGDSISILTYVLDSKTFKPMAVVDLKLTMTLPNGTEVLLTNKYTKAPFEIIPGIYSYTYTLPEDIQGHLTFTTHSSQLEENLSTVIYVSETEPRVISTETHVKNGGRDINKPNWTIFFDEPQLDRYGDMISFDATITHADQATLYLTLLGDELSELSQQPTASYVFSMEPNATSQHWSYEWYPNASIPAGMYEFFVFPTTTDGLFPQTSANSTGKFILLDSEPIVDKENTFLNDYSVQELDELLDQERVRFLRTSNVSIEIMGDDLEDGPDELEAWLVLVELSIFVVDDYVLAASSIPYNPQTQKFEANFTLPENLLNTPKGNLSEDIILVFFFILRDSDGNFGEALAPMALGSSLLLPFGQFIESLVALGFILMGSLFFLVPLLGTVVVFIGISLLVWAILQRVRK